MFSRVINSCETIFRINRLYDKTNIKYQTFLYLNLKFDHCNRRHFITCLSLSNQQEVKKNELEQCEKNKDDKNNSKGQDLSQKQIAKQNNQAIVQKDNNKQLTYKSIDEKKEKPVPISYRKELTYSYFIHAETKNKESFLECIRRYESTPTARRDVVTFITVAMRYMVIFGVHTDLAIYKKLLDLFPKGTMIPTNFFQTMYVHYPKEQYCATDLLDQMENNGVIPDEETEDLLLNIFGRHGLPTSKFWRMFYWMPKFRNLNPWPVPKPVPDDILVLAKYAIMKISSVDAQSKIEIYDSAKIEDSIDKTWIVSATSPYQKELLKKHDKEIAIYVKGPYRIYVASKSVDYFVLKAKPPKNRKYPVYDPDAVDTIENPYLERPKEVILPPCVHEQVDATIFAVCATGTSSQDSLLSWIRFLQKENPVLGEIPVVFTLKNITDDKFYIEENKKTELSSGEYKKEDDNKTLQC